MTNRSWLDWAPSPENLRTCPENELTKLTKSISVSSVGSYQGEGDTSSAVSVPQGGTDKTDKSLSQEQAEAMQVLNLCGVRIMRYGSELRIGAWEDLDVPELRAAIQTVGIAELRVVHLEGADVPIRYKVRQCPDRASGESFEAWRRRALAPARKHWPGWAENKVDDDSGQTTTEEGR
ncbi:MAG: hypothetical protein ACR2JB_14925 [Bryobacteraceae bacterium]